MIPHDHRRLLEICHEYGVASLEIFGSHARGEAHAGSDVDLLVRFLDERRITGFQFVALADELETCFGCPVDLLTRCSVEQDRNPIRRAHILQCVEPLYAA